MMEEFDPKLGFKSPKLPPNHRLKMETNGAPRFPKGAYSAPIMSKQANEGDGLS